MNANFDWSPIDQVLYQGAWIKIEELANASISDDGKTLTLSNVNLNESQEVRGRASVNITMGQPYTVTATADADGLGTAYTPVSRNFPILD